MTYHDFQRVLMDATEFDQLEDYIADVGGSLPPSVPDAQLTGILTDCWDYAHDRTLQTLRRITGESIANFAKSYKIPYRTLQNWSASNGANAHSAPPYVLDLLAYAIINRQ